ncbi:MAG: hypothetical protein DDT29_02487 [Dehalococcoidia bacterium]|nr:hypothetical protein [Bacillota bacterium]
MISTRELLLREEDELFVEQLRLASLKAARVRALRQAILSDLGEDDGYSERKE